MLQAETARVSILLDAARAKKVRALALSISRLARTFMVDVSPVDPLTFAMATAVLTAVASGASYLPARRASRIEPVQALRDE